MRALTIGLDGADPKLIERWSHHLPNFNLIRKNYLYGELKTIIPPISASAWTCFATGSNPAKTGIYDFVRRDEGSYKLRVNNSHMIHGETLWETLSNRDLQVCILNVPTVTWPPKPVKGVMVAGLPSPRIQTYPTEMTEEIQQKGWLIDPKLVGLDLPEISSIITQTAEARLKVAKHLLLKQDYDFFMTVFTAIDRAQHFLLGKQGYEEQLLDVYRKVDNIVGELLELNKDGVTVLLSDHGATPIKKTFNLNDWLIEKDFLKAENPKEIKSIEDVKMDWRRTKAYAYGEQGKIFLNLEGREPQGSIKPKDYEREREKIIEKLKDLKDGGRRLQVKIWRREELYRGPYLQEAPDIIFIIEDGTYNVKAGIGHKANFIQPKLWSADHSLTGIYAFIGEKVKRRMLKAEIYDLSPTILSLYNIKPTEDMDGSPLAIS